MKLLYSLVIWGLIQLVAIKPLKASSESLIRRQELSIFYDKEFELISQEFCEKAKIMLENILQDHKLQEAATPVLKAFQQNITQFVHNYPFYKYHGLYNTLLTQFENILLKYYPENANGNPDLLYIQELLLNQKFNDFATGYRMKYTNFIQHKFLPKLEEFMLQLDGNEVKEYQKLINWYEELKNCQDFECYSKQMESTITPKAELCNYLREKLEMIFIRYIKNVNDIGQAVRKDELLAQLSPALRFQLTNNISDFAAKYETNDKVTEITNLTLYFYTNILKSFYYNKNISVKDRDLIVKMFNRNGYAEFQTQYRVEFNDFALKDVPQRFEHFKTLVKREELAKMESLLKWFDHYQTLNNFVDRVQALGKLYVIILNTQL